MFMHFKRPEYVPVCIYALNNYTINYKICRFFYKKAPKYVLIDKSNRLYIFTCKHHKRQESFPFKIGVQFIHYSSILSKT